MSYESVERKEINLRHNDTRSHACGDCSREDSDIDKKEKEISVEDMQKIVDANEKLIKELKDGKSSNRL